MNMKIYRYLGRIAGSLIAFTALFSLNVSAQDIEDDGQVEAAPVLEDDGQVVVAPLFEYVVAPDDLPDLQSRTDYLMDNFWNPFDFNSNKVVDQNALNHAFGVYIEAMVYASEPKVMASIDRLIKNIKNNPGLTYQFTKAAEQTMYGPRAVFWSDEIYGKFLDNVVNNKKLDDSKKKRYISQRNLLMRTAKDAPLPQFNFIGFDDKPSHVKNTKDFMLLGFIPGDCPDCRYPFLKLDISGVVNDMIEDGQLDVTLVWLDELGTKPAVPNKWTAGYSSDASEVMDLRLSPTFYVVDRSNRIKGKNLDIDDAIRLVETLKTQNDNPKK